MAPRISLVMPSYAMGRYIGSAIDSVLGQTYADFELIVRDAGSTDETPAVLERAARDARVRVVVEPDGGQADAINRGLAEAKGEILGWLNADDELEPSAFEQVRSTFESEPDAELVYGRGSYVDPEGSYLRPYGVLPYDRRLLLTRDYVLQPAAFWRRSLWERVGPLDDGLRWAFDWDWLIRASSVTTFRHLEVDLARYRLTGENKSTTGGPERQAELAAIARRHGGRLQPTYLYWLFTRLERRFPPSRLLEPVLWRLFPGRIMA